MCTRLAILGFGRFGRIHALRALAHPAFEVVCVVDPDLQAREAAQAQGFAVAASIDALPGGVQAAAVVTPAHTHADLAVALMRRGIDVLVEKPMAESERDIDTMLDAVRLTGRHLFTGHIERFNTALIERPWERTPSRLVFHRQSRLPGTARSVVLDLMVHDLDLASYLLRISDDEPFVVLDVRAQGDGVHVQARVGGTQVDLHARHGADVSLASMGWSDDTSWNELALSNPPELNQSDALTRQYTAFDHMLRGQQSPLADAQAGAVAVRRALAIVAKL
ncbi:Gfo/Idh/MocA family protein [Hydrogenophaga sp. RWCD_12]|uniref:Gfo/Idh/MocA family protein n=1 Tax=Hydrogenophaga sp. RWCD_12 TaxID=3391190 RepID=UPI0039855989